LKSSKEQKQEAIEKEIEKEEQKTEEKPVVTKPTKKMEIRANYDWY
jgi:hypothetical protein